MEGREVFVFKQLEKGKRHECPRLLFWCNFWVKSKSKQSFLGVVRHFMQFEVHVLPLLMGKCASIVERRANIVGVCDSGLRIFA